MVSSESQGEYFLVLGSEGKRGYRPWKGPYVNQKLFTNYHVLKVYGWLVFQFVRVPLLVRSRVIECLPPSVVHWSGE